MITTLTGNYMMFWTPEILTVHDKLRVIVRHKGIIIFCLVLLKQAN